MTRQKEEGLDWTNILFPFQPRINLIEMGSSRLADTEATIFRNPPHQELAQLSLLVGPLSVMVEPSGSCPSQRIHS